MFSIWWPAFLLPLAMVLGGVAGGVLPGRKYRGPRGVLPSKEQREADRVFSAASSGSSVSCTRRSRSW